MKWKQHGKCKYTVIFTATPRRCIHGFDSKFSVPEAPDEDAKPKQAPVFVSKPEPVTVEEGEWARFCARVTGHPRPRVMWLINGHTVVNVSPNEKRKTKAES